MHRSMLAIIFLTLGTASCMMSMDAWDGEENYVSFNQSEEFAGEESLDVRIDLKVGRLEVEPAAESLYEIDCYYNELAFEPKVNLERVDGKAKLNVGFSGEGKAFRNLGENVLNVRLNKNVELSLESSTGVSESRLDLTGMKIRHLRLESGVGETNLSIHEPNSTECGRVEVSSGVGALEIVGLGNLGFQEFNFRGGVGGSSLDFSGDWHRVGDVDIEVGVGGVEVLLPRDIGAEIRVSQGLFSGIDTPGFRKEGDTYYSDNFERAEKVVKFRVRAGIGGVEIRWL